MIEIPLTYGYTTQIDESDLALVSAYKWRTEFRSHTNYAVTTTKINNRYTTVRMHAVILNTIGNGWAKLGEHADGNGLNNQRYNLRIASQEQNTWNRQGVRGVSKLRRLTTRPWQARITRNRIQKHLGYFPTKAEAETAYNAAAVLNDVEFLNLNPSNVALSENFLRQVVGMRHEGIWLVSELGCGHTTRTPWFRRDHVGKSRQHCVQCKVAL